MNRHSCIGIIFKSMDEDFFTAFFFFGDEVTFSLVNGFSVLSSADVASGDQQMIPRHQVVTAAAVHQPPAPTEQPPEHTTIADAKPSEVDAAKSIPIWMQIAARDENGEIGHTRARI